MAVLGILAAVDATMWVLEDGTAPVPHWLVALRYAAIDLPVGLLLYGFAALLTSRMGRDAPTGPTKDSR